MAKAFSYAASSKSRSVSVSLSSSSAAACLMRSIRSRCSMAERGTFKPRECRVVPHPLQSPDNSLIQDAGAREVASWYRA